MVRRVVIGIIGLALLGLGATSGVLGAAAAPAPNTCVLAGTAHISPGLAVAKRSFSYTFNGSFTNCKSSDASIKNATVTATGTGTGGCTTSNTTGTATINWNNGQSSTVAITTTGVGAGLVVQGPVTSGEFAGKAAKAVLAFQATPTQCNTAAGVTTAKFNGVGRIA